MPETSLKSARDNLKKASERYIAHKKRQLDKLIARSSYQPSFSFFEQALGCDAPQPGYNDWAHCMYFEILTTIFGIRVTEPTGLRQSKYSWTHYYAFANAPKHYPCGSLKLTERRANSLDIDESQIFDQYDPKITLHNLKVLIGILNLLMNDLTPNFNTLKKSSTYKEEDYSCTNDTLLSLQIEKALKNLIALVHFSASLPGYQESHALYSLSMCFEKAYPKFEEYLKLITVQELKDILDKDINDVKALELAREHVKESHVKSLLEKNHQSPSEQRLKLLSLISIIFGIGVFTTFGLMAKRFYDSGGKSINFFKPLSTNLRDSVEEKTEKALALS